MPKIGRPTIVRASGDWFRFSSDERSSSLGARIGRVALSYRRRSRDRLTSGAPKMKPRRPRITMRHFMVVLAGTATLLFFAFEVNKLVLSSSTLRAGAKAGRFGPSTSSRGLQAGYHPRVPFIDVSGFMPLTAVVPRWKPGASLEDISKVWRGAGQRAVADIDRDLAAGARSDQDRLKLMLMKALLENSEGETQKAYEVLQQLRALLERTGDLAL